MYLRTAAVITNTVFCSSQDSCHPLSKLYTQSIHVVQFDFTLLHLYTGRVYDPTVRGHPEDGGPVLMDSFS